MTLIPLDNRLGETVLTGRHDSGLRVTLVPKDEFSKTFGVFATNFGSVDDRFFDPRRGEEIAVPDGVAHFLEHKMFEDERGDVSDRFSALGAQSNASTGFTTTSYIYSTTEHRDECLSLLLDFVQEPHFTPELVAKEQGIIGQEIRMYDDDPSWRIFFQLLEALYRRHPVRINIAGTEESIAGIDPDVLTACHAAFYRPANMSLTLVGRLDPGRVVELIEEDLRARPAGPPTPHRRTPVEDGPIVRRHVRLEMDVARPKLLLGWKDAVLGGDGVDLVRREVVSGLALELLFGRSSPVHEALYDEGVIDDSFGAEYTGEFDFGFVTVGGDTDEPDRLEARLREEVERFRGGEVDPADFERVRNKLLGKFVGMFDSIESVAYAFSGGSFRDVTPFETVELLQTVRPEEVAARAREMFDDDLSARSDLVPRAADGVGR
ncbi:MAG: EF-P 5-aminopentanol modification-associated protein YfmH [Planctomycetota bacterium JB042]